MKAGFVDRSRSWMCAILLSAASGAPIARAIEDGDALAIVHVRAFTMDESRGDRPGDPLGAIEDATIVLRDGKVEAIGRAATIEVPAGLTVHDGLGRTVMPALTDLHVHLFGGGGASPDDDPIQACKRTLEFGVTTVLDLDAEDARFFPLRERERAERQARHPELPRLFGSGAAITVEGGHGTEGGFAALLLPPETLADDEAGNAALAAFVTRVLERRPDIVKLMLDGGGYGGLPIRPTLNEAVLKRLIEALRAARAKTAVHVVDVERALAVAGMGIDLLTHQPFVGEITESVAQSLARSGVPITPTLATYDAFARAHDLRRRIQVSRFAFDPLPDSQRSLARFFEERLALARRELRILEQAGAKLLPGSDAGQPGVGHGEGLIRELELWHESGVRPPTCLRSATVEAAAFLGLGDRLGKLIPGFEGDLLMVDGNPALRLSDLRRVVLVTKAGSVVPLSGLARKSLEAPPQARVPFLERRVLLDYDDPDAPLPIVFGRESKAEGAIQIERSEPRSNGDQREPGRLVVRARQSDSPAVEPKLGVRFDLATMTSTSSLAGYSALRFSARSPLGSKVRVLFLSAAERAGDPFGQAIAVPPEVTSFRIEFSRLTQIGIGDRGEFDAAKVDAIAFVFDPSVAGDATLELADLIVER